MHTEIYTSKKILIMKKLCFHSFPLFIFLLFAGFAGTAQQDSTLLEYTGAYDFPAGSQASEALVSIENENLYIYSTIGSATLDRAGVDSFSVPGYGGLIVFLRNVSGQVSGIHVQVADIDATGVKRNLAIPPQQQNEENHTSAMKRPE